MHYTVVAKRPLSWLVLCTCIPLSPFSPPSLTKKSSQWSCSVYSSQGSGHIGIPLVFSPLLLSRCPSFLFLTRQCSMCTCTTHWTLICICSCVCVHVSVPAKRLIEVYANLIVPFQHSPRLLVSKLRAKSSNALECLNYTQHCLTPDVRRYSRIHACELSKKVNATMYREAGARLQVY